jgi:hypothetical protein
MASGKMRFTDSARGIDGFAAEWFFLVHKAFRPALDITFRQRINPDKTKEIRDNASYRIFGKSHDALKKEILERGEQLADSPQHQEILRYAYRESVETVGSPQQFSFRTTDGIESRCGRWYVQVLEIKQIGPEEIVVFALYSRNAVTGKWNKTATHELSQPAFAQLLRLGQSGHIDLSQQSSSIDTDENELGRGR